MWKTKPAGRQSQPNRQSALVVIHRFKLDSIKSADFVDCTAEFSMMGRVGRDFRVAECDVVQARDAYALVYILEYVGDGGYEY